MNHIKTKSRDRLKSLLQAVTLIYTSDDSDIDRLDKDAMAKVVAHKVWGGRKWATEGYMMMLV